MSYSSIYSDFTIVYFVACITSYKVQLDHTYLVQATPVLLKLLLALSCIIFKLHTMFNIP